MSDRPLASAYAQTLSELAGTVARDFAWPSPQAGFALFVFHKAEERGPVPSPESLEWPAGLQLIHAPALAAAGYWFGCGQGKEILAAWLDGIERLRGTEAFSVDRQSFGYRPLELLGLAVGIAACVEPRQDLVAWMKAVLERASKDTASGSWAVQLRMAAWAILAPQLPHPETTRAGVMAPDLALSRWCTRCVRRDKTTREDSELLRMGALDILGDLEVAPGAVLYQSLRATVNEFIESEVERHWQVDRTRRNAEELVVTLCRRFHLFAQQLLVRRQNRETVRIRDEYDVQDLMHALLKLHFEDVRPEEVTPSRAGSSGRMDFLLKRECLVVETKMTRASLGQKEVTDELIVDMERYRAHPDYRTMVCFVYDPDGRCKMPTALENDLTREDGEFRVRAVVCPKEIGRTAAPAPKRRHRR